MAEQRFIFNQGGPAQAMEWVGLVVGVLLAILIGAWIGVGYGMLVAGLAALLVLVVVVVSLQQRAWLLIVLFWSVTGYTAVFPVPVSAHDIAILLAAAAFITHRIISGQRPHVTFHPLDLLLYVNLAYLAFTFVLHPVGMKSLGASTIGGRPYLNIAMAVLAYWVILRLPSTDRLLARIPLFILFGTSVITLLHLIAYFLPGVRTHLTFLYAALDVSGYFAENALSSTIPRYAQLGQFGMQLMFVVCAYYPPQVMFQPWRPALYLVALAWINTLLSGFRSYVLWLVATFVIGAWLHRGWRQLVPVCAVGGALLGLVLLGQGRVYELPLAAQRALGFLPGKWAPIAEASGETSSNERFQWWRQIIQDGVIENWVFGDGFGFNKKEQETLWGTGGSFYDAQTLYGGFHSGPLSSIRYVGLVGLALLYVLMIATAVYAVRCVNACRGTLLLPVAIYVAIQCVWWPIHFTFVFGAYESHLPEQVFCMALLRLLIEKTTAPAAQAVVSAPVAQAFPATARVAAGD